VSMTVESVALLRLFDGYHVYKILWLTVVEVAWAVNVNGWFVAGIDTITPERYSKCNLGLMPKKLVVILASTAANRDMVIARQHPNIITVCEAKNISWPKTPLPMGIFNSRTLRSSPLITVRWRRAATWGENNFPVNIGSGITKRTVIVVFNRYLQ